MREFLDDADAHRTDGYARAKAHARQELPKRFYKDVGVAAVPGGYAVTLDGKSPRTPGLKPVAVPLEPIASAMATEWAGQGTHIDPEIMPMVRLINSAVEVGEERVPALRAEIIKFAGNDLLLYRADTPQELVAAQERVWDAVLVKLARHFGIGFQPTIGITHQPQPAPTLERLAASLGEADLVELVALNSITGIAGSGLLAIALREGLIDAEEVWTAAHVDEDHNIRLWGAVEEATERRVKRKRDFDAAVRLLEMVRA